jgi:hypothetical protein
MLRTLGTAVLLCLIATGVRAQATGAEQKISDTAHALTDSTAVPERGNTVIFPFLGYTPDTGLLGGASLLRFFYLDPPGDDVRPSLISPVVIVTAKRQFMVFLGTDLNWGRGRWHAGLVPGYQRFPDDFYGIGRDVPKDPLESFTPEQFAFEGMIERKTLGELRLGLNYRVAKHRMLETEAAGVLESGQVPGSETSVVSAPGLQLAWDTRDNTWSPRGGLNALANTSFFREGWGSDYRWTEYTIDLRGYVPVGERGTLAAQVLYTTGDGTVPFYRMPRLGGQSGLRGYSGGRFLDRTMALGRVEWRSGEVWKRVGGAVFAGYGDVAPTPDKLTTAARLYTYGLGMRITLNRDEQVKIRIDFGFGNDDGGFFLSLGEAF